MEKKKILYIGNKLAQKGSNATAIDLLGPRLQNEGFSVVAVSDKKNKIMRFIHMMTAVISHASSSKMVLIDTYSTLNFQYAVYAASICRMKKVPYVPILHGGNLPNRLQQNKAQCKKLFGNAKVNVAPSHYLMEAFSAEGYTNLVHIPNTLEISQYPFLLRKEIKPRLLWVRSFAEIYNPTLAISVVKILRDQGMDASLTMVGPTNDATFETCKQLAAKYDISVEFTGKLPKDEWIRHSEVHDIFINTTNFDNTPVSVIEAMALGLPVVSTNVGGLPYLIESGKTGVLVPPNDAKAFADAITDLCKQEEKARSIAKNARQKVEQFDWQQVKQQWISLLSQ